MKYCSDESVTLFKLTEMAEQVDNTYYQQLQKIERIANGVNLDTFASLTEVLRHRQRTAQQMVESLKMNPQNVEHCVSYLNSMNELVNELLITKL